MKYCPKCKRLYNDGDAVCAREDCKNKQLETVVDETTSVYLCSGDVMERDRVQAALSDSGIPSDYVRHMVSGNSQLITGADFDTFDILVPYELYDKAYDVAVGIGAVKLDGEEIVDGGDFDAPPAEMSRAKRTTLRLITAILFFIVLALVIFGTDYMMDIIKKFFIN